MTVEYLRGEGEIPDRPTAGQSGSTSALASNSDNAALARVVPFTRTVGNDPIRILIVDDEPLIRWAVAETLIAHGCQVVEAGDARSAIGMLSDGSRRFDVVVLDYRLPDAHDLTLLATIRRLSPMSHVVMMTALMGEDIVLQALKLGASRVLQKPVELEALARLVLQEAPAHSAATATVSAWY